MKERKYIVVLIFVSLMSFIYRVTRLLPRTSLQLNISTSNVCSSKIGLISLKKNIQFKLEAVLKPTIGSPAIVATALESGNAGPLLCLAGALKETVVTSFF